MIPEVVGLALAFGLVGALPLGLGLYSFLRDRRSLPQYSEVGEGVVCGFTEPDDEGFDRPLVRFSHGKVTVTITGSFGSIPREYRIGQRVPVRYPPGRPDVAIIADFNHLHLSNVAFIGFGAAGVGVAVLLLVLHLFVV
jgi:hypothetical protein